MKTCLRIKVLAIDGDTITDSEVLDLSLVADDHAFEPVGRPKVGDLLHIEGSVAWPGS